MTMTAFRTKRLVFAIDFATGVVTGPDAQTVRELSALREVTLYGTQPEVLRDPLHAPRDMATLVFWANGHAAAGIPPELAALLPEAQALPAGALA